MTLTERTVSTFDNLTLFWQLQGVYCGKWGSDAKSLYVGAADHNLRYFSAGEGSAEGSGAVPMTEQKLEKLILV